MAVCLEGDFSLCDVRLTEQLSNYFKGVKKISDRLIFAKSRMESKCDWMFFLTFLNILG